MKDSTEVQSYPVMLQANLTSVKPVDAPVRFGLSDNYPNPFNPTTAIGYQLSAVGHVTLKVYDVLGREVATLVDEVKRPGSYVVRFDGLHLASGVYFDRLVAGGQVITRKMVLMK